MILKHIDDKLKQIQTLKDLLSKSKSEAQKRLISADLKRMKSGDKAEQENAYYLDFEFKNSKNVILLHDIRIEHEGRTAQLDHLLISRFGIELLETKSSSGTMTINHDGSLTLKKGKYSNTHSNPLEQSKRHAAVLRAFISASELLSKRIDILGGIDISSKVLINPKTTLTNEQLPDGFERADSFISNRTKEIDDIGFFKAIGILSKGYNIKKTKEIAQILIDAHTPVEFDYTKKYRITKDISIKKDERVTSSLSTSMEKTAQVETTFEVCPRCNEGELVIKKIKSKKAIEKYNNDEFKGCSRYPKCRYTEGK